jgi:hypothetical protein
MEASDAGEALALAGVRMEGNCHTVSPAVPAASTGENSGMREKPVPELLRNMDGCRL